MTYEESIRSINVADALHELAIDRADTPEAIAAYRTALFEVKQQHRETFGTLRRVDGEWV